VSRTREVIELGLNRGRNAMVICQNRFVGGELKSSLLLTFNAALPQIMSRCMSQDCVL
jgi:hypothetical protein